MARERNKAERASPATIKHCISLPAVREIIAKVGHPIKTSDKRLLDALNEACEAAYVASGMAAWPSEVRTFERLVAVRATARRLTVLLGVSAGRDIRDTQGRLFSKLCREADDDAVDVLATVAGVERLHRWVDNLTNVRPKKETRLSIVTMLAVGALPPIYTKHFGRQFGASTNRKESRSVVSGPALRFVVAALKAMGQNVKPAAVAKAWRRRN